MLKTSCTASVRATFGHLKKILKHTENITVEYAFPHEVWFSFLWIFCLIDFCLHCLGLGQYRDQIQGLAHAKRCSTT